MGRGCFGWLYRFGGIDVELYVVGCGGTGIAGIVGYQEAYFLNGSKL